ncbi:unnamed protein product, partial [Adineta steineri]
MQLRDQDEENHDQNENNDHSGSKKDASDNNTGDEPIRKSEVEVLQEEAADFLEHANKNSRIIEELLEKDIELTKSSKPTDPRSGKHQSPKMTSEQDEGE